MSRRKRIPGGLGFDELVHKPYTCPIKGASTEKKNCMGLYPDMEETLSNRMPETLESK